MRRCPARTSTKCSARSPSTLILSMSKDERSGRAREYAQSHLYHRRRTDDRRVRNRPAAVLTPRQAGIVSRRRQKPPCPARARVRRQLRVHDVSRHHPRGRAKPQRDAGRRGGSPRHRVGSDAALAPRLPGRHHRRRRLRAADVHAELRSGRRRHPAWEIGQEGAQEPGGDAVKWADAEDIGIALVEKFPGVDPLTLRFTDLREKVLALDEFDDDPKSSNEPKLEAIQMAWHEEYQDRT